MVNYPRYLPFADLVKEFLEFWPAGVLSLERDGSRFSLVGYGLHHLGLLLSASMSWIQVLRLIRRSQPRLRLRHGLYRYSRLQSENHNGNGSHGGPVAWHIHPSYPGIFLFSFQSAGKVRPRFGPVGLKCQRRITAIIF